MIANHFQTLLEKTSKSFDQLLADGDLLASFTKAFNFAEDFEKLALCLENRPERSMFALACLEFQRALHAAAFAQYRQAHISLRLFYELSLSSVLFSAHEIEAQLWLRGQKDVNWNSIISTEGGVFSNSFLGAFWPELKGSASEYMGLSAKLYRECSEFVHGNPQSFVDAGHEILFDRTVLLQWIDRADTARLTIEYAFLARFLPHLSHQTQLALQDIAIENFGHLVSFQSIYEKEANG